MAEREGEALLKAAAVFQMNDKPIAVVALRLDDHALRACSAAQ